MRWIWNTNVVDAPEKGLVGPIDIPLFSMEGHFNYLSLDSTLSVFRSPKNVFILNYRPLLLLRELQMLANIYSFRGSGCKRGLDDQFEESFNRGPKGMSPFFHLEKMYNLKTFLNCHAINSIVKRILFNLLNCIFITSKRRNTLLAAEKKTP